MSPLHSVSNVENSISLVTPIYVDMSSQTPHALLASVLGNVKYLPEHLSSPNISISAWVEDFLQMLQCRLLIVLSALLVFIDR